MNWSAKIDTAFSQNTPKKVFVSSLLFVGFALWISFIAVGHLVLFEYEMTAGPLTSSKRVFPFNNNVEFANGRQNILLFLHPMCPCSTASVDEFSALMKEEKQDPIGTVIVDMPKEMASEWSRQPILTYLKRIRNVSVVYDTDGKIADTFGAVTSGHVMIYDNRGILQFSGGITGSRGHTGENAYFEMAKRALNERSPKLCTAPVFGCSLR